MTASQNKKGIMKNLMLIMITLFSFAIISTSCSKSGCPGHITKEYELDKELKSIAITSTTENWECVN